MTDTFDIDELLAQAAAGDETALTQLFTRYRKRLKQMVRLRLNRRLQGRVDDSDILQEAYLEAAKRLPEYLAKKPLPFFLWLPAGRLPETRTMFEIRFSDDAERHLKGFSARD